VDARRVERLGAELGELRALTLDHLAVAGTVAVAVIAATRLAPSLVLPLLVGGAASAAFATRAAVRRHRLIDELAVERDAYLISEVRCAALRAASRERRRRAAAVIRADLDASGVRSGPVEAHRAELEALVAALLDERLAFDPAAAVALDRMLGDGVAPVIGAAEPVEDVRARLLRILNGFDDREAA
jgi:hypothetical protein